MNDYCLYHKNCRDGFGAAWVVKQRYPNMICIGVQYGERLPTMYDIDVCMIVDFSYPRDILEELKGRCNYLRVIDHHKTAKEQLEGLQYCVFDMNKSGAVLTWEYLFAGMNVPELLLYIQDRDLWKWELPDSEKVNTGLELMNYDMDVWSTIIRDGREGIVGLKAIGGAVLEYKNQMIRKIVEGAQIYENVAYINSGVFRSEIGDALRKMFPQILFSIIYYIKGYETIFSLRSGLKEVDGIAKYYGGGGHKDAAEFNVKDLTGNMNVAIKNLIDEIIRKGL